MEGDDDLRGQAGSDNVSGGAGNDRLEGGDGSLLSQEAKIIELAFAEIEGEITPDSSLFGSENNGELKNGVIIDTQLEIAKFDGVDDYIRFRNREDLNAGTHHQRTVSLYFKADDIGISDQSKRVLYEEGGGNEGLNIYLFNGNLYVGAWHDIEQGWNTFISTDQIEAGTWHNVTVVLDAEEGTFTPQEGALRGYVDGVEFAQGSASQLAPHFNPVSLGAIAGGTNFHNEFYSNGNGTRAFAGEIDKFKVFNRALSLAEIEELAEPFVSLEEQIIALELETINDGKTPDSSPFGSDNPGIVNNGVIIDPVSDTAQFDGIDDYISFDNQDDLNLQTQSQRTISLRFRAEDIGITERKQVLYEQGGGARGLNIYLHNGSLYVGAWHRVGGDWTTFISTDKIEAGTWHNVTLVLDAETGTFTPQSGALRGYLDGEEFAQGVASEIGRHPNHVALGAIATGTKFHDEGNVDGSGTQAFAGEIDNLFVYNRVLTNTEIAQLSVTPETDYFVFESDSSFSLAALGVDKIVDFTGGVDKIVLDLTTFDALLSTAGEGFLVTNEFAVVNSEADIAISEALIVYHQQTGGLFYNPNGVSDGLGTGGQFAYLSTLPELNASDFSLQV